VASVLRSPFLPPFLAPSSGVRSVIIPKVAPRGVFFTAGRMRLPTALGTVTAGKEVTAHKSSWVSDDFEQNDFYIAIGNFYTDTQGVEANGSAFTLQGASVHAFYGGTWKFVTLISAALANPLEFAAGQVRLIGPFTFPAWVPAASPMSCVLKISAATNATIPVSIRNRTGTFESATITTAGSDASLEDVDGLGGSDGRLGGQLFAPHLVAARAKDGLTRPVFRIEDDSIAWGKNSNENVLVGATHGAMGAVALAMESKVGKRRYPYANCASPGISPDDLTPLKDALIKLFPNRPYTHIIMNASNNVAGPYAAFKASISGRALKLKTDSQFWGDAPVPILHLGALPKPGTTNWATDLAGQTGGIDITADRFLLETDIRANAVPGIDYLVKNERIRYSPSQRDKMALTGFTSAIATGGYTSGAGTINLDHDPGVGSMLVVNPGGGDQAARHVTAVSGTGPFACTLETSFGTTWIAGVVVKTTYTGDSGPTGTTHPATPGHVLWSLDIAEDLGARYG
jgi:hypothetical protein